MRPSLPHSWTRRRRSLAERKATMSPRTIGLIALAVAVLAAAAITLSLARNSVGEILEGTGTIEATEVRVGTKVLGRIQELLVREGGGRPGCGQSRKGAPRLGAVPGALRRGGPLVPGSGCGGEPPSGGARAAQRGRGAGGLAPCRGAAGGGPGGPGG